MIVPVKYSESLKEEILTRRESDAAAAEKTVKEIIGNVKKRGDAALYEYTRAFDKAELKDLKVGEEEIKAALSATGEEYLSILKTAAANITAFHEKQLIKGFEMRIGGKILGEKNSPLAGAGIYVPGGTAAYPSTVLMNAVPAKVAGVKKVVMTTPPDAEGKIGAAVLAAAAVAGVDEIYKIGGAQAIAALAYGTESIPKVDVIAGPGNIFVTLAKKEVYGDVGIDMLAGPSEILIIADGRQKEKFVAADVLSQAEHDRLSRAIVLTDDAAFAERLCEEVERQIEFLPRKDIARASLENGGGVILVEDMRAACELANEIAPENADELLESIDCAGAVFLGSCTPEPVGDYFAGPDHILPTGGTAKFFQVLNQDLFLRKMSVIKFDERAIREDGADIVRLAESEGLRAHANAVRVRLEEK